ncbi:carbohydrate ABC transporter permease [Anaerocolumna jejuensis]|uniref:carbohydrate ABC transporter permease n=1 Tax=Anaerocolumna jejuensis TaxID=259063 RepID=UPI003F7B48B1
MKHNNSKTSMHTVHIKHSFKDKLFQFWAIAVIALIAVICVVPFIFILSGSFSSESAIAVNGFSLLPQDFTLNAYKTVLRFGNKIPRAYLVTIFITIMGTSLGMLTTSMSGFVLSRQDFKYRNTAAFFIYFTTLFSAGMIPAYLVNVNILHLNNNILVLILPSIMNPFNIFLFRNFLKSIPDALMESARIDGAGDFTVYWRVMMPLAKPAIATIGLFLALGYWNEWYRCNLYIKDQNMYTLQYLLYNMLQNVEKMFSEQGLSTPGIQLPSQTMKLATAMLATGPVLIFYPFVQKYFTGGLIVGGVKG